MKSKRIRKDSKAGRRQSKVREGRPVRACLVEVIGVYRSRTKVKRRKAFSEGGELASSSNALFPWVLRESSGDEMGTKSVDLTRGALPGSAKAVGRTTREGKPTARQSNENRALPNGRRKAVSPREVKHPGIGKVVPVNEQAIQLVMPFETVEESAQVEPIAEMDHQPGCSASSMEPKSEDNYEYAELVTMESATS